MISNVEKMAFDFVVEQFCKGNTTMMEVKEKGSDKRVLILFFKHEDSEGVDLIPFGQMFSRGFDFDGKFEIPKGGVVRESTGKDFENLKRS
jgi:hypothetical protein